MSIKKLLILCLSLVMVFSMVACGSSKDEVNETTKDIISDVASEVISDALINGSENTTNPSEESQPTETPTESETPSEIVEFQTVVDSFLKANIDGVGMVDMVGIFKDDELVEHIAYYDDALLAKAMKKNDTFGVISKANSLTVENFSVLSRGSYSVSIKSDLGETCELTLVKVDDKWVIDVSELFVSANITTSNGVDVYINGVAVPKDYLSSRTDTGSAIYTMPYLLALVENTISYDTILFGLHETVFVVDGTETENLGLIYKLSVDDLENYYPQIIDLWTKLNTAAHADDTAGVSALLSEDSQLSANVFLEGHNPKNYKSLTLISLKPRPDYSSYMISPTRLSINLVATFNMVESFDTGSPSKYNWVVVDITDSGLKIFNCSNDVWIDTDINIYSDDN